VWIAITTAFSRYLEKHGEEMRKYFVEHEEQKELEVFGGGTIMSADWADFTDQLCKQIEKNTKGDVKTWLEPNFSTTTETDRFVG